jgi:Uma2 family endonuclease
VLHNPDKILIPDVAFVRAARLPPEGERWHIAPFAPNFAVEVVSPNDTSDEVNEKIELYQRAGVPLIWIVLPPPRVVDVYVLDEPRRQLREGDVLDGGDVIPDFRLPVAEIFR